MPYPAPRRPDDEERILEGELLSARGSGTAVLSDWAARFLRPLRTIWLIAALVTGWLLWLTLKSGHSGLMDSILAMLLILPLAIISLVMFALNRLLGLMQRTSAQLDAHLYTSMAGPDPRAAFVSFRSTFEVLRNEAASLGILSFMLTPPFFAAVGFSLLALLIMTPVALFTALLALF